jgi:hypothetical protein
LQAAVRILPEWQSLDWEAGNCTVESEASAVPQVASAAGTQHTEL